MEADIRRARPDEARALRELAHRSKAHWPYSGEFLEPVRPLLRLEPDDVREHEVWVLQMGEAIIGWHRVTLHGARAELEDLWLEPRWIGTGRGRQLFEHAAGVARGHGAARLEWDAEPYAEGFYRSMGGEEIGRTPSVAEVGRTLPRMALTLSRPASATEEPAAAPAVPAWPEPGGEAASPSRPAGPSTRHRSDR